MSPQRIPDQLVRFYPDEGGHSVSFYHVYEAGSADDRRGAILILDPPACYWRVTESKTHETRSLTYGAALKQWDEQLTLAQFGSLAQVREQLRALFE